MCLSLTKSADWSSPAVATGTPPAAAESMFTCQLLIVVLPTDSSLPINASFRPTDSGAGTAVYPLMAYHVRI